MQRAGVGADQQSRAIHEIDEFSQIVTQLVQRTRPASAHDFGSRRPFPRRRAADEHSLETVVAFDDLEQAAVAFRWPILVGLAATHDDGTRRPIDRVKEASLLLTFLGRDHDPPLERFGLDAQVLEELEILILHVLIGTRWDAVRREQPVEVTGPGPVEAQFYRRPNEAGD